MSTVITLVICAILVVAITVALVKGIWVASKKITIPVQIALFVIMLICVGRMLFTKENAKKLYDGVEQSGVSQNMENTVRSVLNMKPAATPAPAEASAPVPAAAPAPAASPAPAPAPAPAASPAPAPTADAPVAAAPAPAANEPVAVAPAPVASVAKTPAPEAAAPAPKPAAEVKPDYSRFDKGKKSFSYALPFSAQVKVGFRDGTYRIITESLGTLSASEKKEIGKMVMNALSEYSGEKVMGLDKSKVTIDAQYDESANRTRVFVTVPPSAIE